MIISHKHKFIFISIPKTGSHSIRTLLRQHLGENDEEQCCLFEKKLCSIPELNIKHHGHHTAQEIKNVLGDKIFNEYFKFAFVRDPVDRLISTYYFFNRNNSDFTPPDITALNNFYENQKSIIHLLPQYKFIYSINGDLLVNYIGYTNNMDESLAYIFNKLKLKKFTNIPRINQTLSNNYKHLDEKVKNLVHRLYYNDYAKISFSKKEFSLNKNCVKYHGMLYFIGKINLENIPKKLEKSTLFDSQLGYSRIHKKYITRKDQFNVHKNTENIILIWTTNNNPYLRFEDKKMLILFESLVSLIKKKLKEIFKTYKNPIITKLVIAKLLPNSNIPQHIDNSEILRVIQRIHIPIITNSDVTVKINNKQFNMEFGKIYNFNNTLLHSVSNNSNKSRIHLIIDYVDQTILDQFGIKIKPSNNLVF